ncbi:MAG: SPOR domain-containing protein, partial [Gammaproteobacteria bacterium]|nr:SPOR domain-containing protein [Gammaproteobacteria bacterium]
MQNHPLRRTPGKIFCAALVAGASLMLLQSRPAQTAPEEDPVVRQLLQRLDELDRELAEREATISDVQNPKQAVPAAPGPEHNWVVSQAPQHLTIQVMASPNPEAVAGFARQHGLEDALAMVMVPAGDHVWYKALYGSYATPVDARAAQRALQERLKSEAPWLRKFADVHHEAGLTAYVRGSDPPRPRSAEVKRSANRTAAVPEAPTPASAGAPNRQAQTVEAPAANPRRGAPGSFEVDEDAAERALERTLTEEGALLLPAGRAEIDPSFTFLRREQDSPLFADVDGDLVLTNQQVQRNEAAARVDVRLGLPWNAQLEFGLPYNFVDETRVADLGPAGRITESNDGNGLGDLSIGFAKTLLRESGARPDLLARFTYDTDSGDQTDGGVALDGGFNELRGELVALKRQDPLAFV